MWPPSHEFGPLGDYLAEVLASVPGWSSDWISHGLTPDLVKVHRLNSIGNASHPAQAVAASLLLLQFPVQLTCEVGVWLDVCRRAYRLAPPGSPPPPSQGFLTSSYSAMRDGALCHFLADNTEAFADMFPPKALLAGETKLNVVPIKLLASAIRIMGSSVVAPIIRACAYSLTDDRLCGTLLYASVLRHHFGDTGTKLAVALCLNPDHAKGLTTATKALGLNSTPWGAVLCEAQTLAGRAFGSIDLEAAALHRCDLDALRGELIHTPAEELRADIRAIIEAEMDMSALPPLDEFWSKRWLWCVNGSHTAQGSRALDIPVSFLSKTHTRVYRRPVAEELQKEPITTWDGRVYVSPSAKLEHGKTRAIFACDTKSYFAFTWLLNTVQGAWRNKRVLLDPGVGGHVGLVRRIQRAQGGGGVNLMLDYDDFNSHHTNEVMAVVFDELCRRTDAPAWYRDKLVSSFDDTHVLISGQLHKVAGTLMSGHRGTTAINSILNAAYIRHAVGASYFDSLRSLHTGDDVYMRCDTVADCHKILTSARALGCRMNPSKQSIGFEGAEFLRIAMRGGVGYGYVARSIASFVSGNWANPDPLAPLDALQSAVTGARSIINRGGCTTPVKIAGGALRYCRSISVKDTLSLLLGETALEGGPVFNSTGSIRTYRAKVRVLDKFRRDEAWRARASRSYLSHHLTTVELEAIQRSRCDILNLMAASSYSKGLDQEVLGRDNDIVLKPLPAFKPRGTVSAGELIQRRPEKGALSGHPLIQLVKNRLTPSDLVQLLHMVGINDVRTRPDVLAFGPQAVSKNILGALSYSDASALSKRTTAGTIFTPTPCYV
uniref:RNA-directed RNA polymerase n=1 Tax=Beauveria bassiana victorivirus 3 TaxID=1740649 RepID=A0AA51DZP9_9VIRU|nr:RNA-dependent RNA polymerase [Beauveria bassiana victorivirus 3]